MRVAFAFAAVSVALAPQHPVFRSATQTVPLYATVHDRDGHLVLNLAKEDFQVADDKKPVDITTFSNDIVPITVVLMLDMSESMAAERERVRQAALRFVAALRPGDRVRVGTFGDEVAVSPWLTGDQAILTRILQEEVWPGGETPLWSGLRTAMNSIAGEPGRRVVLVLSDGGNACSLRIVGPLDMVMLRSRRGGAPGNILPVFDDSASDVCASFGEVERVAVNDDFMIYVIGMEGPGLLGSVLGLADETGGGRFELKRNADLASTTAAVAEELHHQYAIGFQAQSLDGRLHAIDLAVARRGLTARARRSYLAVASR